QPAGTPTTCRASVTTTGPKPPAAIPITRSPTRTFVTPGPASRTTPATSLPITPPPGYIPRPISTSRKLNPPTRTATRTRPTPNPPPPSAGAPATPTPPNEPPTPASSRHNPPGTTSPPDARANRRP